MKKYVENIIETIRFIFGIAFIIAMIFFFIIGIRSCDQQYTEYRNNLPTYCVSYGNFTSRITVNFETYKCEGNHYTFFDENGNLVGDFTVTGNNQISIIRNIK